MLPRQHIQGYNAAPVDNMFDTPQLQNQAFSNNPANNFKVEIVSFYLTETGTYDDLVQRNYKANLNADSINSLVGLVAENNMNTRGDVFGQIASSVLDLDARSYNNVIVPNGWGTQRFRFMLQMREISNAFPDAVFYTYIQGFSDMMDITLQNGILNPNTIFFVNSFIRIVERVSQTPTGPSVVHMIQDKGQLINGKLVSLQNPHGQSIFMRPVDVWSSVQISNQSLFQSQDVIDARSQTVGGSTSVLSSFENNTPTNYLSRLITPAVDSLKQVSFGPASESPAGRTYGNASAMEPSTNGIPSLALMTTRFGHYGAPMFTLGELGQLDPTVGSRTHVRPIAAEYKGGLSMRGRGAEWNNALPETLLAQKLLNIIPGVMWSNYVGMCSFSLTNQFGAGKVIMAIETIRPITQYIPQSAIQFFIAEMENTIARDISYNNQIMFNVKINASVMDDIQMQISTGSDFKLYIAPAFTSGIVNPVYAHDTEDFNKFSTSMNHMASGLEAVMETRDTMPLNFNV